MPRHTCLVPGCGNVKEDQVFSFFSLPTNPELRQAWLQVLGIRGIGTPEIPITKGLVCHSHFHWSQYKVTRVPLRDAMPTSPNEPTNEENPRPLSVQYDQLRTPENAERILKAIDQNTNNIVQRQERKIAGKNKMLKRKDVQLNLKQLENKRLRAGTSYLQTKILFQTISPEMISSTFSDSKSLTAIMKMQVHRRQQEKKSFFTAEEKTIAITIFYSCGRNGYRTIQNLGFILPALSTIRRWISRLKFPPGRDVDILECLKNKVAMMNDKELDCMITMDETSLTKNITYNRHTDAFEGFQNHGDPNTIKMQPANHALVVLVRFLTTNIKMPLAYYFNAQSTTTKDLQEIMRNSIDDVMSTGARVRAVVTDQGGPNQGLAKELGISVENPCFIHKTKKVYFIYDAPHILKCLRNNLMNHDYVLNKGTPEQKHVKWSHIYEMYERDQMLSLHLCPRLTTQHFELGHFDKMKVKWAAQVLSKSVAAGLKVMIEKNRLPQEYIHTANFVERVDEIFDLLNISSEWVPGKPIKSAKNIYSNLDSLLEHKQWVSTIKSKVHVPTLKGLQITLQAMHSLITDLRNEGYKYVLTRRLQSDPVEHFFSLIKFKTCGSPTPSQFRRSYRYVSVCNLLKAPEGANCEEFADDELVSENEHKLEYFLKKISRTPETQDFEEQPEEIDSDSEFESDAEDSNDDCRVSYQTNEYFRDLKDLEYDILAENAAALMAGWTIKKTITKTKCLGCQHTLLEYHMDRMEPGVDADESLVLYKAYDPACFEKRLDLSYGHLIKEEHKRVFKLIAEHFADKCFNSINQQCSNVVKNTLRALKTLPVVRDWLSGEIVPICCEPHRAEMVTRFLIAIIFDIVKRANKKL